MKKSLSNITPFTDQQIEFKGEGFYHHCQEYVHYSSLEHHETAFERLTYRQATLFLALFMIAVCGLILDWHTALTTIVALITLLYFLDMFFNLFLILRGYNHDSDISVSSEEIKQTPDREWPKYTILCPLYKEGDILPQFVEALTALDYDKSKLQVLLLLEETDKETQSIAKGLKLPPFFETVVVPHSLPQTKPKACNYGLKKATGEYIVIYDAEDIPERTQLKKAYIAFSKSKPNVACLQCKLDFYNPYQNLLTKSFTTEYLLWFNLVLTGLHSISSPIPLGGTSNHFRVNQLKKIGAWDAFNVTEDADLGVRLARKGYITAILDSTTLEEANSDLLNWFYQRRRWVKGYMQTYFVHSRRPQMFKNSFPRPHHAVVFQMVIGGKFFSALVNPIFWVITISYFALHPILGEFIQSFYPPAVLYIAATAIIFGNFLYMYYYMMGCAKRKRYELIKYAYLAPIYWLMMSIAAWAALYEIILKPHYWNKTKHGLFFNESLAINGTESGRGEVSK